MATIEQDVAKIRSAVYGRDVREAIADGIENCYANTTSEAQIAAVEQAGAATITHVQQAVTDSQTAVNQLDSQKETIAEAVASMASLGTDTSLSTSGMAADAKATGDEIGDANSAVVLIQSEQPTSDYNRVWITQTASEEVEVPTNTEFKNLDDAFITSNNRAARDLAIAATQSVSNWVPGYIQTGNSGTVIDPDTVIADENYKCCVLDVVAGEQIFVCGNGGNKEHKLMTVLDSTNKIIAISPNNAVWNADGNAYTIPDNGVKLVCNAQAKYYANVYKNTKVVERITALEKTLENSDDFDLSTAKSIVLLGDSITQGVGSSDYSATGEDIDVSVHPTKRNVGVKCWGNMFVSLMTERYGCSCINNGVSEFTMQNLLSDLDVLLPDNTDYVILMIGTNNRSNSVSDYETRMTNLITGILNKGAKPFVFSTVPVNSGSDPMALKQQITQKVCHAKKVPFFPMYSEIESYINTAGVALSTLYADALHPNDRGYEVMFGIFRKLLKV